MIKFALIFSLLSFNVYAIKPVTKVVDLVGDVLVKNSDGTISPATINLELNEGSYIKTSANSKIDLAFIDNTIVTVGPNALFKIQSFTTEAPGILALIRGEIRSKVSKEYMEIEDKNKSKLFVRTKTAAMGVRGTEFDLEYDEKNEKTTLVTLEGKVAFNQLQAHERNRELNQHELDSILERKERLLVERGQTTMVDRRSEKPEKLKRLDDKSLEKIKEKLIKRMENKKEISPIKVDSEIDFKDDISLKPIDPSIPNNELRKDRKKDDSIDLKRDRKRDNRLEERKIEPKDDASTPTKTPIEKPGTIIKR